MMHQTPGASQSCLLQIVSRLESISPSIFVITAKGQNSLLFEEKNQKYFWFCLYTLFVTSQKRHSSIIALTASRCACLLTSPFENARQSSSGCVRFPSSGSILHLSTLTEVKVVSEQSPLFLHRLHFPSDRSVLLVTWMV